MSVPTPHIGALAGDFARTVIMPGDPLRAKFIADTYLTEAVLINKVRGMYAYTGKYKGITLSVMASGMGMPSMAIYSHELFAFYGVENIIRTGTAGAVAEQVKLRDIVIGMGCCTDSAYMENLGIKGFAPIASYPLITIAEKVCMQRKIIPHVGNLLTSDMFYAPLDKTAVWRDYGVLAVEMESAALYVNALRFHKRALTICTVSDCPFTGESLNADQRQKSFTPMMEIALDTAVELEKSR